MKSHTPFALMDIVAGAILFLFLGTTALVVINGASDTQNKVNCAKNLHQIGLAILLYQNENTQLPPRTIADTTGDPKPIWGSPYQAKPTLGPDANSDPFDGGKATPTPDDVSASLFLLARNEDLKPAVFICPATKLKPWDFGGKPHVAKDWTNWIGNKGIAEHLSYSYQNPFPANTAIANGFQLKNPDATFAIAADMNPGGAVETKVTLKTPAKEMTAANSLNHNQSGQNILYGDGHVEWQTTPFSGTQHDNIYTAFGPEIKDSGRKAATIISSSYDNTDSILLPTSADVNEKH